MSTPQDPFEPPRDGADRSDARDREDGPPGGDQPGGAAQYGSPQYGSQPGGGPQYGSPQYGSQPGGGQQYGGPQYGGQPYGAGPGPGGPKRNGLGVAALVVGVLALLSSLTLIGGIVLGIAAIVLGVLGRGRAKRGEADNGGMALAGVVLGVVGLLLSLLFLAIGVAIFSSESGQDLADCLEQAGDDQAAIEDCQRRFVDSIEQ
jgi:hypothetical protein